MLSKLKKYNRGYQRICWGELALDQTVQEGISEEVPCKPGPEELNKSYPGEKMGEVPSGTVCAKTLRQEKCLTPLRNG